MKRLLLLAPTVCAILLAGAGIASAHDGAAPFVLVQSEFVLPGQPFQVIVTDVGEDAPVDFAIAKDQRTASLGSTRAAQDGHLMVDLELPDDFPLGYAQLSATVPDVLSTSTWVLVGEPNAETPPPPNQVAAAAWWSDPSVILLGVLLVGVIGAIGYLVFKPRQVKPQAAVPSAGPRRSAGKRSRR